MTAGTAVASPPALHGFNNHTFTSPADCGNTDAGCYDKTFSAEAAAGATVDRVDLDWALIETARDQYSTAMAQRLSTILNEANRYGIKPLLIAMATPCWASSDPLKIGSTDCSADASNYWKYPPTDPSIYGKFVGWLTRTFGSQISGVEVWNEPNAYVFFKTGIISSPGSMESAYASLVESAHRYRVKAVPIVAAALSNAQNDPYDVIPDTQFMDGLFWTAGFVGSFDVWSHHVYATTASDGEHYVNTVVKPKLAQYGVTTPIWIDEFGWSTCTVRKCGGVTLAQQGQLLATTFGLLGRGGSNVAGAISYELRDDTTDRTRESSFGVLYNDYSPKPAYGEVQTCLTGGACQ